MYRHIVNAGHLMHNLYRSMWAYLSHVADLLVNIHTVLQKTTSTQKQDSLKALRASLRRRSTSIVLPPTANPVTIGYNIPPGPSKDNELILSVIDYLTQGIIPLLHAFYTNYFDPVDLSSEQLTKELTVSAAIATRLIVISSLIIVVNNTVTITYLLCLCRICQVHC